MSVTLPSDAAGREALAGEYVLGTLDRRTAAAIAIVLPTDPSWRAAIEGWESRLGPLFNLARPESPPADGWDRIEARIAPARAAVVRPQSTSWLWRGWALGASLATAALAAFILMPRPQPVRMATVLSMDKDAPSLIADVDRAGRLRLASLSAFTGRKLLTPPGRSLQIWGVPPGATVPADLGVLPDGDGDGETHVTIPSTVARPVDGMLIEISLEPQGGSPTGRPTGPVVFYGRLVAAPADPEPGLSFRF